MLVAIYRVGSHIVLPGIDPIKLELNKGQGNGILDLINTFAGGAFNKASIFALGIMPYISASIFMQLMTVLVPKFQKMQKEGDSGRKKINQYTRYLTVLCNIGTGICLCRLSSPDIAGCYYSGIFTIISNFLLLSF